MLMGATALGIRIAPVSSPVVTDDVDCCDRLLRYVKKGPTEVGRKQLRNGNAKVYVYDHNPFDRVASYRSEQTYAKWNNLGLWGHC